MSPSGSSPRLESTVLLALFGLSGATALVYEVLWLKELGRLFGVTAHAAATTLAVFFLGLAAGGWVWGRRSSSLARPLRTYAYLELAIAASAVLYFFVLELYRRIYPPLVETFGHQPLLLLAAKLALAAGILFPPAFFMGGTLPIMGQYMIRQAHQLGLKASLLYGVNTLGAALGALAAGFFLPVALGFRGSYSLAIGSNVAIAIVVLAWSRWGRPAVGATPDDLEPATSPAATAGWSTRPGLVRLVAFASGFLALALEVLWVRMHAQVLQNSVYTFSAILTVFLLALALGSVLAHALCRRPWSPWTVLFSLLTLSGLAVGLTPWIFHGLTGLEYVGRGAGWAGYVATVFAQVAAVVLIPGAVIGSVFPYLMKLSEAWTTAAGRTMGQLGALNTGAAILGSLLAGFVLLDTLGLWASVRLLAALYLLLAIVVLKEAPVRRRVVLVPIAGIVLLAIGSGGSGLASVHLDAERGEELLYLRERSDGTVAVVRDESGHLRMKLNNSYALGGSESALLHRRHAWIPLSLHLDPRSVFFLGMGTGLSAGAAIDVPLRRIVVSELSPTVVEAARLHFAPYLNGLFEDPRVEILAEDGRTRLFASRERFDVIVADLFLPWKAGTGNLYSREHFETVRARLNPGGVFAQWLPLAQLSPRELATIARTMLEAFPQVTVWRRGFSFETPALAFVGQAEARPLDPAALERHLQALVAAGRARDLSWLARVPLAAYAGNLTAARGLFDQAPVNTDDRPLIEYAAPVSDREASVRRASSVTGDALSAFYASLLREQPPGNDPYLAGRSRRESEQVLAGLELHRHVIARRAGRGREARHHLAEFERLSGVSALVRR